MPRIIIVILALILLAGCSKPEAESKIPKRWVAADQSKVSVTFFDRNSLVCLGDDHYGFWVKEIPLSNEPSVLREFVAESMPMLKPTSKGYPNIYSRFEIKTDVRMIRLLIVRWYLDGKQIEEATTKDLFDASEDPARWNSVVPESSLEALYEVAAREADRLRGGLAE